MKRAGVGDKTARRATVRDPVGEFKRALPAATHRALRQIGRLADEDGYRSYLVGGIVRDIALGYPDTDLDVVIDGRADLVARAFAKRAGGVFKRPTDFATCKVEAPGLGTVDFAGARTETYGRPGALPQVRPSGIEQDLWRSDFSINAMAISLAPAGYGALLDPCGGMTDLRLGKLRVMHRDSFADDPTRVLRGIRFAVRYGFAFDRKTAGLVRACVGGGGLATVSGKRLFREIRLICDEPGARRGLAMLESRGVLHAVLGPRWQAGRCRAIWGLLDPVLAGGSALGDFAVRAGVSWLASLFAGVGPAEARRLSAYFNLPGEVRDACLWVAERLGPAGRALKRSGAGGYRVKKTLDGAPTEALMVLAAALPRREREGVWTYLTVWSKAAPVLGGGDIVALGCRPGPEIGRLREAILRLKLAGKISTRSEEIAYVRRSLARRNRC